MQESTVFLVRVQCRRTESSRSLSHRLMSFLLLTCQTDIHTFPFAIPAQMTNSLAETCSKVALKQNEHEVNAAAEYASLQ